mmetsp:Transcript_13699/g.20864  ORF Transcript_13699/g.20864 Transcript_13699/m.20864 type:complete len:431 (-) Transcript_13699:129-1421(-)
MFRRNLRLLCFLGVGVNLCLAQEAAVVKTEKESKEKVNNESNKNNSKSRSRNLRTRNLNEDELLGEMPDLTIPDTIMATVPDITFPPVSDVTNITAPPITAPPITAAPIRTFPPSDPPVPLTLAPFVTLPPFPTFSRAPVYTYAPVDTAPPVTSPPAEDVPGLPPIDFADFDFSVGCFSGTTLVVVEHSSKGLVEMRHLKIGDAIKTASGNYEPVYSFAHYDPQATSQLLEIDTSSDEKPLQVTLSHLLFVKDKGIIPASAVQLGDKLMLAGNGSQVTTILSLKQVQVSSGLFAPLTLSGTLVVNGIVASSFIALMTEETFLWNHWHWLSHAFELPHRLVCHNLGNKCLSETYKQGISNWMYHPMKMAQWVLQRSSPLMQTVLLTSVVVVLSLLWGMEQLFSSACGYVGFVVAILTFVCHSRGRTRKYSL